MKRTKLLCLTLVILALATYMPAWCQDPSTTRYSSFQALSGEQDCPDGQGYEKLVDGDVNTKWCTMAHPSSIEFKSTQPVRLKGYVFTTGDDTQSIPGRNPKTWKLQGRQYDSGEWTTIDSVVGYTGMPASNLTDVTFMLDHQVAGFQFFRFEVAECVGTPGYTHNYMQLSELQFLVDNDYDYWHDFTYCKVQSFSQYYQYDDGKGIDLHYRIISPSYSVLTKGIDYLEGIRTSDNVVVDSARTNGDYTLTLTGMGDYSGVQQFNFTVIDTIPIHDTTFIWGVGGQHNYKVTESLTINGRVRVHGKASLTLGQGCTLTVKGCIQVNEDDTLIINGPGALYVHNTDDCGAGIGGTHLDEPTCGTIVINGGQITCDIPFGIGIGGSCEIDTIGTLVLGWTDETDFVSASFRAKHISFANGKSFIIDGQKELATSTNLHGNYTSFTLIPATDANVHDLKNAQVSFDFGEHYYSGEVFPLTHSVTDVLGNPATYTTSLKLNGHNVSEVRDQGSYKLTFHGTGAYTGSQSVDFSVDGNPTPTNLLQTGYSANSVTVSWKEAGVADQWLVHCSQNDQFTFYTAQTVSDSTCTFDDLLPNETYYVRVKALNGQGESDWTDALAVETSEKIWIGLASEVRSSSDHLPFTVYDEFTFSQQIYTSEELGDAGTITAFEFHGGGSPYERDLEIHITPTDKIGFSSIGDWIHDQGMTVFGGGMSIANGWTRIDFSTPFCYDGQQNICISVWGNSALLTYDPGNGSFDIFRSDTIGGLYNYSSDYFMPYSSLGDLFPNDDHKWRNIIRLDKLRVLNLQNNDGNAYYISSISGEQRDVRMTGRTLYKDGSWNTLCLPFDMTPEQIAASPLADAVVMLLDTVTTNLTEDTLTLNFFPSDSIFAGIPCLIKWTRADDYLDHPDDYDIHDPFIHNITVSDAAAATVTSTDGTVSFVATYNPVPLQANDQTTFFMDDDNALCYPSQDITLGACRAYFRLNGSTSAPARIILNCGEDYLSTDLKPEALKPETTKFLKNGVLYILHDGVLHDALGRIVK